ncbi:MAG: DnaJ family domain-containing protein [Chloroflexia bacterium]
MLNWHLLAERRILAAMERGEFDNLPGHGRPLQWRENPLVPPDWRLAFDLLERAGLAPDWIMRQAEIRTDLLALQERYAQERRWMEERRAALATMPPEERRQEQRRLRQAQARSWQQIREFIERLNRKIADFNLLVPIVRLQYSPLNLTEALEALRAAWGTLDTEETE